MGHDFMTSWLRKGYGPLLLAAMLFCACGSPTRANHGTTPSTGNVTLGAGAVTVTPSRDLQDGQDVTVAVRGLPDGIKFFISECLTPTEANDAGCGPQVAQQPFGLTGNTGSGSTSFTVQSSAAATTNSQVLEPCTGECVVVVTPDVSGAIFMLASITFASTA